MTAKIGRFVLLLMATIIIIPAIILEDYILFFIGYLISLTFLTVIYQPDSLKAVSCLYLFWMIFPFLSEKQIKKLL